MRWKYALALYSVSGGEQDSIDAVVLSMAGLREYAENRGFTVTRLIAMQANKLARGVKDAAGRQTYTMFLPKDATRPVVDYMDYTDTDSYGVLIEAVMLYR